MKITRIIENKRRQMERDRKIETTKNVVTGTVIGTALGALAGLLFAPKSGKETREDIAIKSKEVAENVKKTVNEQLEMTKEWQEKVKTEVKENIEELKHKKEKIDLDPIVNKTEEIVDDLKEGTQEITEIVMDTANEIKKEL